MKLSAMPGLACVSLFCVLSPNMALPWTASPHPPTSEVAIARPHVPTSDAAVARTDPSAASADGLGLRLRPAGSAIHPDLLVTTARSPDAELVRRIGGTRGVRAVEVLDTGVVRVGGARVAVLGVQPESFRRWTPDATRRSDALWSVISAGQVSADFDVSKNLGLRLGSRQTMSGHRLRLGAHAQMAVPAFDLTVSGELGRSLGLLPRTALLVSAPGQDLVALRTRVLRGLLPGAGVTLLQPADRAPQAVRGLLTEPQIARVLQAATAQVGKPYVWGATGPDGFDCSGLVGFAFSTVGLRLPRTAAQLYLSVFPVPSSQARAGDLLFWANDPSAPTVIDHVALYLGAGLMVAAPHTGDIVHVSRIPGRNFRGVGRLDLRRAADVGGPRWK